MKAGRKTSKLNRRGFLRRTLAGGAVAAAPMIVPSHVLGLAGAVPPSEKIVLGGIGLGRRGSYVLSTILPQNDVRFVAVADVWRERAEQIKGMADKQYGNNDCVIYRDMFDVLARGDIDAVVIATGDRWHALASLHAVKAGKDVYCEKPCGMTMAEIQALAEGVTRYGRIFQVGTQRRSQPQFQYAAHLAHSGKLGRLHTMHAAVYTPTKNYEWLPAEPEPPKDVVDWDRWIGPSPWRPFNRQYLDGRWRGHHDFEAGGNFLDWGAHTMDLCQWANQADHTTPIEFEAGPNNITGRYANGVKVVCDFLRTPFGDRSPHFRTSTGTCPVRFEGDEGWVETGDSGEIILSDSLVEKLRKVVIGTSTSPATHTRNFFDCVRTRTRTVCNQDVMRKSHIACFAAQLSWQLGRKLTFDPVKEEFVNDDEANRMRRRATREPWTFNI